MTIDFATDSSGFVQGVEGLSLEQEAIELTDGPDPFVRKNPGTSSSNVTTAVVTISQGSDELLVTVRVAISSPSEDET